MHSQLRSCRSVFRCCLAAWLAVAASSHVAGEEAPKRTLTWSLREEFRTGAARENPNSDRDGQPAWHFLRTTRSEGPIESRKWLRDGHYAPLTEKGDRVFGLPFDGWIFRLTPAESPVVSAALEDKAAGLSVQRGDIVIAPGPEHAVIVAWESPVAGLLDLQGSFEHVQASGGITWYVERGPQPHTDANLSVEPVPLASGQSVFGTESQKGTFKVEGQKVAAGLLARRLVEAGVRMVFVQWPRESGDLSAPNPLWDTHAHNDARMKDVLCPQFDLGFTALLEDLKTRGLLDETLVVAVGEMGRTPKINANGGRDHWGNVFGFAMAGAGAPAGLVHGASDRQGAYPAQHRVTPSELFATILHYLGIQSDDTFPDPTGRPMRVVEGEPIAALI